MYPVIEQWDAFRSGERYIHIHKGGVRGPEKYQKGKFWNDNHR